MLQQILGAMVTFTRSMRKHSTRRNSPRKYLPRRYSRINRTLPLLFSCLLLVGGLVQAQEEAEGSEGGTPGSVSYLDLKPAFVVNYGGVGKLRYLKTDIALRLGGGPAGQSQIRHHMPYVRHTIVMRLSRATEEELSSMEGKELLRQSILEEVRNMLIKEEGEQFVDDLLFNSFIVQR